MRERHFRARSEARSCLLHFLRALFECVNSSARTRSLECEPRVKVGAFGKLESSLGNAHVYRH